MANQKRSIICASILLLSASLCLGQNLNVGDLTLKAVKINDQPITPSNQITANPGDIIECDIILSNWSPGELEFAVRTYEIIIIADSFFSGNRGTVLPLGWDAPYAVRTCSTDDDCNGSMCNLDPQDLFCFVSGCFDDNDCMDPFPVCLPGFFSCVSINHNPELGAFIDEDRHNFIFNEVPPFAAIQNVATLKYKYGSVLFNTEAEDQGVPVYLGTLILEVSDGSGVEEEACGTFEISFAFFDTLGSIRCQGNSFLTNLNRTRSCLATAESLFIEIDCNPPDQEFIPTVSQWGMVIMTLMLLIGGKLYFGYKHVRVV